MCVNLSLYQKLAIVLTCLFLFIASVFYFWGQHLEQKTRFESQQRLHLSLAPSLVRDNPLLQKGVYDYDALKNLFHTLMILGPAFEFYLLDKDGYILNFSDDKSLVKRDKVNLKPIDNLIQYRHPLPVYGDDPKHPTRQKIFSATPIFNGSTLMGYLYVIVAGERYVDTFDQVKKESKVEVSLVMLTIGLAVVFILMLWLFRNITSPLRLLNLEMTLVTKQGFNTDNISLSQWQPDAKNEVHQLGAIFTTMMAHIEAQFKQLENIDHQRKELLAEISHDLRTPLASLHGYLETLHLKKSQLTKEQEQAFVATSLRNACQLRQLIDQIFELAHLENGHVNIVNERFNLVEVLYDIIDKFALEAKRQNIDLVFSPVEHHIVVISDLNKLERVITNLIDNALRHTPAGGKVELIVKQAENGQYQVSIKDSGIGIKQEELEQIFNARYQASNSIQTVNQKNIGLGLTISQKLIELLGSEISVESELGVGSQFSFCLVSGDRLK